MGTTSYSYTEPEAFALLVNEEPWATHPFTQYDLWCTEIGKDPVISLENWDDAAGSVDARMLANPPDPSFFDSMGYTNTQVGLWSKAGGFGIYPEPCSNTSNVYNFSTIYHDGANYFVDRPPFMFNIGDKRGADYIANTKAQRSDDGEVAIFQWHKYDYYNGKYWRSKIAVRIEAGNIEVVGLNDTDVDAVGWPTAMNAAILEYDDSNNKLRETLLRSINIGETFKYTFSLKQFHISGSINELLDVNKFRVDIQRQDNGYTRSVVNVDTNIDNTYNVIVSTEQALRVTVQPECTMWKPDTTYLAGDVIYPTVPSETPYYYRTNSPGISGAVEPTWPIEELATVVDNTITWNRVDHLVQPQTHGPLIPVEVI